MPNPVGEDSWVAFTDEARAVGQSADLEQRVKVVELYKSAVGAEPGSLKVWKAYCEYFWSLYSDCHKPDSTWPDEERQMGRELFSLDAALQLWQQAYTAIKYRLNDSHELWDRWISLEMELLEKTRTAEGVKRITHLYRNRLQTPHATWDNTAQMFSSFLSEHNRATWEETMQDVTARAQAAKHIMEDRNRFEIKLGQAQRADDDASYRAGMKEYLEWEIGQSLRKPEDRETAVDICRGLFLRALTGVFATDEDVWFDYVVYLSTSLAQSPHSMLDVFQQSVDHCPWSGKLWSRFILGAEEAKLPFPEVEKIKHAATSNPDLYKDGLTGVLDVSVAWCGFLKRTAMNANATDEDVDLADVGLNGAIEDIDVLGKRTYGREYRGDPDFRLERIYIQYLTEKKGSIDEARAQWEKLAGKHIYADSYNFWLSWYVWEMMVFGSNSKDRSPTPSSIGTGPRVPSNATAVLARALHKRTLDWPERIMEVYLQHCNGHELPSTLRAAIETVHKVRKGVVKRREREAAAAYANQAQQPTPATEDAAQESPTGSKRKRGITPEEGPESAAKRARGDDANTTGTAAVQQESSQKRDRENTTVVVSNLPLEATQTKVRQYFKEYGHINNLTTLSEKESTIALIEFSTPEEAQSALLRDQKYFGSSQISVKPGTNLTLFVSNYPPAADEQYLRKLFKDCGDILNIRQPSLRFNTHRRFAYITFRDVSGSAAATQLDGTILEGRYKLQAKYSDPSQKKARDGAIAEGRELCIKGLDQGASDDDVRDIFSKYGDVNSVRVLRNRTGASKGTAFVVFASKDQSSAAVSALDKTKFRGQILTVEISTPSNFKPVSKSVSGGNDPGSAAPSPVSSRDDEGDKNMTGKGGGGGSAKERQGQSSRIETAARTIALMGLPDTVNDARVRALVEPMGEITRIVLQPNHGGATIEFVDAAAAGRAGLQLDGREFAGRRLRTGTVAELHQEKAEKHVDRIVYGAKGGVAAKSGGSAGGKGLMTPLPTLRRPVLGRGGPKRGLGFVAAKKEGQENSGAEKKTNGIGTQEMKSNADFKAMFLAGKEGKGESQTGQAQNGDSGS